MTSLNTPLFLSGDGWIVDTNGKILAETYGHNTEEAQEIVRCANAFDKLVQALKFYADRQSWQHVGCISFIGEDQGELAIKALLAAGIVL